MTTQLPSESPRPRSLNKEDEIDLLALFGKLLDRKWFIVIVTAIFAFGGIFYALTAAPVYRATAMLQVEKKTPGLAGIGEMAEMFAGESEAVTEIELLRSRLVLGRAIEQLGLDTVIKPVYFPVIGEAIARRFQGLPDELAESIISGYAWGGEELTLAEFTVPDNMYAQTFTFVATNDGYVLLYKNMELLRGSVGQLVESDGIRIQVKTLKAHADTEFTVVKNRKLSTIKEIQKILGVSERGRQSGIISASLDDTSPIKAVATLNAITENYVLQNVARNAAEASKSLEFLQNQLPEIKKQLERAEELFNKYQVSAQSVNILAETEALLKQMVEIEAQISQLQLQRAEVERRFRPDHPTYQALVSQLAELEQRKQGFQNQVTSLPATQQELLRLRRDVEVSTEIYTQMLNAIQELDIVRAGTIGNARIVDDAEVDIEEPVKPQKALIVVIATLLGGMFSVGIVLIQAAVNRGVENPEQIEELGLPVYAAIPYSDEQEKLEKRFGRKFKGTVADVDSHLLAVTNSAALSIEALRGLRTSIHFAMLEAKNNILMISGPSPSVGKSFVSANLAAVIAQSGQKVLLIDADMRKGYVHKMFRLKSDAGLSDYLIGRLDRRQLETSTEVENLSIIGHGTVPPNPSELLMSQKFADLMQELSASYDLVIIDTPPILAVTDAAIVGKQVGATLMVTRFATNPLKEIEIAARRFERNGIDIKGVIFNGVERKGNGYGYGYGYYNYEYTSEK